MAPLRSLPRVFLSGIAVAQESYELPKEEADKFAKVLRLAEGAPIAVLPNDGSLIRCEFRDRRAWPISTEHPHTERDHQLTLCQALPKGDRLETVLRMGTELGVANFVIFHADRSIVRWEAPKVVDKLRRYEAIVRESAEQSFRTKLPTIQFLPDLAAVLTQFPAALVLSELEGEVKALTLSTACLIVGPEGGWSPREVSLIGDRGVTLGPLVLRTDTAGIAAAARLLIP